MKNIILFLLVVCLPALAQQILIVSDNYVLIDTDQNIGDLGDYLLVSRKIEGRYYNIGTVQLVKFQNGKTAAKIIQATQALQKNDRVDIKMAGNPVPSQETQPTRYRSPYTNSLGLNYQPITFIGDSKDQFLKASGVEFFFEQRFGDHFALRGALNYQYMEWELFVGYYGIGVYQYAEPEVYGVSISPTFRLPIIRNTVELSIAPILGVNLITVWYEVDSGIPSYTFKHSEDLEPETKFSFGTDACLRVNATERLGIEVGVRWQNLDVMGGFSNYKAIPVEIPESMPVPEINVDVTTLIYRFGLVIHL